MLSSISSIILYIETIEKIDKDNDGGLDKFIDLDIPTDEEKALLNNHFIKGRINIYYIEKI